MFNKPWFPDSDTWLERKGASRVAYLQHHLGRKTQSDQVMKKIKSTGDQWTDAKLLMDILFLFFYDSGWQGCFPARLPLKTQDQEMKKNELTTGGSLMEGWSDHAKSEGSRTILAFESHDLFILVDLNLFNRWETLLMRMPGTPFWLLDSSQWSQH